MGNTGRKIILQLKELAQPSNTPTGNVKPNVAGEADYVAPYQDLTACPVTFDTVCPSPVLTNTGTPVSYEFALPDSSIKNPSVASITVSLVNSSNVVVDSDVFSTPFTNYFTGSLTPSGSGNYTIRVEYKDNIGTVLQNCNSVKSVTI